MHKLILLTAAFALAGCSQERAADPAIENDVAANVTVDNASIPAATPATMSLNETSWTFTRKGKDIQESIDASGNYIANAGAEHIDHGTYVAVGDKACFTSAMDKEGQVCWTAKTAEIGETMEAVSDKGEKLMVKRVAYVPATMPAAN